MFSLIITIISIALVAALATATLYFGGDAFGDARNRSTVTQALQEGNQVAGALELYKADNGSYPTGTSDDIKQALLAKEYLKQVPNGNWEFRNDFAVRTDMDAESCKAINKKLGLDLADVPSCDDPAYADRSLCCNAAP